jgi:amidase
MVAKGERLRRRGRPRAGDGQAWLRHLDAWFEGYDVLLSPVIARPAPPTGWARDVGYLRAYVNGASSVPYTQAWNLAGFPALSLPIRLAGQRTHARPGAVQIVAPAGQDATVLALATQLEEWLDRQPVG